MRRQAGRRPLGSQNALGQMIYGHVSISRRTELPRPSPGWIPRRTHARQCFPIQHRACSIRSMRQKCSHSSSSQSVLGLINTVNSARKGPFSSQRLMVRCSPLARWPDPPVVRRDRILSCYSGQLIRVRSVGQVVSAGWPTRLSKPANRQAGMQQPTESLKPTEPTASLYMWPLGTWESISPQQLSG